MGGRGAAFESKGYFASINKVEQRIYKDKIETAVCVDQKGSVIFTQSSGVTNYVLFTPEQLSKMKNATLTHNHPSNSTFSGTDISLLTNNDLKSIRATGVDCTYQLTKIDGAFPRNDFAKFFNEAYNKNKAITDREYDKIAHYKNTDRERYERECDKLNIELNSLNSKWLKDNSKRFGYRYGVIERRR